MTNEELEAIESRANAATPGPWAVSDTHAISRDLGSKFEFVGGEFIREDDAVFACAARRYIPALVAEVRRLKLLVHQQEITGLGAVVLVAEIERLKAENSALKQSIAESKRIFEWYLDEAGIWCLHAFGAMASIYPNGTKWYWSVIGDMSGGGIVDTLENAFAEAYKKLREGGRVRPIDTIIRPEEPHQ